MKIVVNALIKNPEGNKLLIIKRDSSDKIHPWKWAFPGGIVEKGEDLLQALKREIKEETGLRIKDNIKKISEYEYKRPNNEVTYGVCFSCMAISEDVTPGKGVEDFTWIKPYELSGYKHIQGLEKEVSKAFRK